MKMEKIHFLTILLITILVLCGLTLAEKDKKKESKKDKIAKFMRDLHGADSLNDLMKYGLKTNFKPPQLRSEPKVSFIMGRGSYKSPSALRDGSPTDSETVIDATPGKCDPKPVCISNPLTLNINSTQFAFPPCINIHRCDGCCPTNENCVAIGTHEVKLQKVGIISFDGESQPAYDETSVIALNHTECQCQCQWKNDDDCRTVNPNLIRNPLACECICPEEMYCDAFHQFDKESCSCKCRKDIFSRLETNCKMRGFHWNDLNCKCEAVRKNNYRYSRSVRIINRGEM